MKKELFEKIEIPEGIEANIEDSTIIIKGPGGENKRKFEFQNLEFEKEGKYIKIGHKKATKREKKMINTIASHIRNMIKGIQEKFEYKLKACFSHFPMSINIEKNEATIKNFLGEKIPRKVKILEQVDVELNKDIITIKSVDRELAGQTAANFEAATRIRGKDRRVFQDGIFITSKCGKEI